MNAFSDTAIWANALAAVVLITLGTVLVLGSGAYFFEPHRTKQVVSRGIAGPFALGRDGDAWQVIDSRNGDPIGAACDYAEAADTVNICNQLNAIGFRR